MYCNTFARKYSVLHCISCMQGECDDTTYGESFVYDALKDELVVGEIYVRVFNEQPTFVLEVCE